MSGSLSGGLWGLVLGSVGLGVVSLVNDPPSPDASAAAAPQSGPEVAMATDELPDVPVAATTTETADMVSPGTENMRGVATPAIDQPIEPAVEPAPVPEPVVEAVAPFVDTSPIAPPQAPVEVAFPTLPGLDEADKLQDSGLSRFAASALPQPAPDAEVVILTTPAAPPPPVDVVTEDASGLVSEVEEEPRPPLVVAQSPEVLVPEADTDTADAERSSDGASVVSDTVPESQEPTPEPGPLITTAPQPAPVETEPASTTTVRVNRPGATPSEIAGQTADVVEAEPLPDDAPALERYAAVFEGDPELPLMSIVMIDGGGPQSNPADIAALPVPVTVVVNALQSDAEAKMAAYRDAGIEVLLETALPQGAMPTDVEVAFEAAFAIIPESIGFFSDASGILQGNRSVAEQVVEILGAEGRGLVVVERGLSNSMRIAEQAGLPAAAVLLDLDGDGQDGTAVVRALDQAAFRARQSGNAVLLARASDETLEAVRLWAGENNGDQIGLAPVSAVLRKVRESE